MKKSCWLSKICTAERFESMKRSDGTMPLALLLTVFVLMISLGAVTTLVWQTKSAALEDGKTQTAVALNSGIAAASQQAGSIAPSDCASLPQRRPTTWTKNTESAATGSLNSATRSETGLFRWWADCTNMSQDIINVTVESTSGDTYSTNNAASYKAQKMVNLKFQNKKLVKITPASAASAINPLGPGNLLPVNIADGAENGNIGGGWQDGGGSPLFSSSDVVSYQDSHSIQLQATTASSAPTLTSCFTTDCVIQGAISTGWSPVGTFDNPWPPVPDPAFSWDSPNDKLTVTRTLENADGKWRGWQTYTASAGNRFSMTTNVGTATSGSQVVVRLWARSWSGAVQTSTDLGWTYSTSSSNGPIKFDYTTPAGTKTVEFGVEVNGVGVATLDNIQLKTNAIKWFPTYKQQDGSATYAWDGSTLTQTTGTGHYARAFTQFPLSEGTNIKLTGTLASAVTNSGNVQLWVRAWSGEVNQSTDLGFTYSPLYASGAINWTYTAPTGTKTIEIGIDVLGSGSVGTAASATINSLTTTVSVGNVLAPAVAGTQYTASGWYYSDSPNITIVQAIRFYTNGVATGTVSTTSALLTQGQWTQVYVTATAPVGATSVSNSWNMLANSNVQVGSTVYGDEFAVKIGTSP